MRKQPTCAGEAILYEHGGDVSAFVRSTECAIKSGKARASMDRRAIRRREYYRWLQMLARCHDEKHHAYAQYGGRGIWVHLPWHDFETFFREVGPPPGPGRSLDRIDNDLGYEPGNIRWATAREQARNTTRNRPAVVSRTIEDFGEFDTRIDVRLYKRFATQKEAQRWVKEIEKLVDGLA